jgi:hypothetical protein
MQQLVCGQPLPGRIQLMMAGAAARSKFPAITRVCAAVLGRVGRFSTRRRENPVKSMYHNHQSEVTVQKCAVHRALLSYHHPHHPHTQ